MTRLEQAENSRYPPAGWRNTLVTVGPRSAGYPSVVANPDTDSLSRSSEPSRRGHTARRSEARWPGRQKRSPRSSKRSPVCTTPWLIRAVHWPNRLGSMLRAGRAWPRRSGPRPSACARPTATEPALQLLDIERVGGVAEPARAGRKPLPGGGMPRRDFRRLGSDARRRWRLLRSRSGRSAARGRRSGTGCRWAHAAPGSGPWRPAPGSPGAAPAPARPGSGGVHRSR
jgi:hypothetical protein